MSRAHHSAVHTFQGRKASLPRHRRGCRRPATELLPSRLGAFAFSNASYGTTPFPAVRTEGQLLQGAPIPPFRSWITDISIKLIIQIVVSHGPLKSHSVNASLARSIVWIMQANAVSMWSLHVATSWKVQVLVDVLSFFFFFKLHQQVTLSLNRYGQYFKIQDSTFIQI